MLYSCGYEKIPENMPITNASEPTCDFGYLDEDMYLVTKEPIVPSVVRREQVINQVKVISANNGTLSENSTAFAAWANITMDFGTMPLVGHMPRIFFSAYYSPDPNLDSYDPSAPANSGEPTFVDMDVEPMLFHGRTNGGDVDIIATAKVPDSKLDVSSPASKNRRLQILQEVSQTFLMTNKTFSVYGVGTPGKYGPGSNQTLCVAQDILERMAPMQITMNTPDNETEAEAVVGFICLVL